MTLRGIAALSVSAGALLEDAKVDASLSEETFVRMLHKFIEAEGSVFGRVKASLIAAIQGASFAAHDNESLTPFDGLVDAALSKCGMAGLLKSDVQAVADSVAKIADVSMRVHSQTYRRMLKEQSRVQ
eukprot:scaffold830_cov377-Prasinococcus_capsulatus_cf.AAC.15